MRCKKNEVKTTFLQEKKMRKSKNKMKKMRKEKNKMKTTFMQ